MRYLRPSIVYSVPCDGILQKAYCDSHNTGMAKILAKLELEILTEEVTLVANIYVVELFAWSSRSNSRLALFMFM